MTTLPKVTVVTPVHNRLDYTRAYLRSLRGVVYPNFDVVIIDDGSTDGSREALKAGFPEITVLHGDGNLWWTGGTNVGVEWALGADADYVLTMNNDVEVDPQLISSLVDLAERRPHALIGCKICDNADRDVVTYFGGKVDWPNGDLYHIAGRESENPDRYARIQECDWLTGMGVLASRQVFESVGLYDACAFPHYSGDVDLSMRAKKAGFELLVNPGSVVWNKTESTGLTRPADEYSASMLWEDLFELRSLYHLKTNLMLYWRHCPRRLFPRAIVLRYVHYFRPRLKAALARRSDGR